MARCDQSARVRAVNRQNSKYFRKNPPLIEVGDGFFLFLRRCDERYQNPQGTIMIAINTNKPFTHEEMLAALTHIYLELRLSLGAAREAAEADMLLLDASELVAEAT